MSETSSDIHLTSGEKINVDGTPAEAAERLATTSASSGGFHILRSSGGAEFAINRDNVTHITAASGRPASFA